MKPAGPILILRLGRRLLARVATTISVFWGLPVAAVAPSAVRTAAAAETAAPVVCKGLSDRSHLDRARVLYKAQSFSQASQHYGCIGPKSDYWIEAREELGWVEARLRRFGSALSHTRLLMSEHFFREVGPEPYLLQAYIQTELCDHKGFFETLSLYRKRMKERLASLETIDSGELTEVAVRGLEAVASKGKGAVDSLGKEIHLLPRLFYRDATILAAVKAGGAQSPTARARMRELAQRDLKEFRTILSRLQILEADVIARLYRLEDKKGPRETYASHVNDEGEVLYFGASGKSYDEWIDELGSERVSTKGCPVGGKRAATSTPTVPVESHRALKGGA